MALRHSVTNLPLTTSLALWTCYLLMVPGISPTQIGICRRAKLTSQQELAHADVYYNP